MSKLKIILALINAYIDKKVSEEFILVRKIKIHDIVPATALDDGIKYTLLDSYITTTKKGAIFKLFFNGRLLKLRRQLLLGLKKHWWKADVFELNSTTQCIAQEYEFDYNRKCTYNEFTAHIIESNLFAKVIKPDSLLVFKSSPKNT